jgi:hypothetical protein
MNVVSPCQASKHKLSPVKTNNTDSYTKKSRNTFSPIFIPGTPEATIPDLQEEKSSDTGATHEWGYQDHDDDARELENLDLYYKIFNMNRPEPGESNSEAAARHQTINDEYEHLLEMQSWDKQDKAKLTQHGPNSHRLCHWDHLFIFAHYLATCHYHWLNTIHRSLSP